MNIRKRSLPSGWYPDSAIDAQKTMEKWKSKTERLNRDGIAGIAPHAGWDFSGALAFSVFYNLTREIDTIAVVGGHLPQSDKLVAAYEAEFVTPFGRIGSDREILALLRDRMDIEEDIYSDNTVEIQLPFIKYLFEDVMLLYLRVSPTAVAIELGKNLNEIANDIGRRIAVVGSTDLTHYGPAYGFSPAGKGEAAVEWVRQQNDRNIINAFVDMQHQNVLQISARDQSACSAGGAVAASAFAGLQGIKRGKVLGHSMSCDTYKSDSFVGYAGILYC
jgi:MEMO1 family protein